MQNELINKIFYATSALFVLLLSSLLVKYSYTYQQNILGATNIPFNVVYTSNSNNNEVENIVIKNNEINSLDSKVWLIRLRVDGGEILEVNNLSDFILPACENNNYFDDNKVCVDLGKKEPFLLNEALISIKVKWNDSDIKRVVRLNNDSLFNGERLVLVNTTQVAGDYTSTVNPVAILLIFIGIVLLLVVGIGIYQTVKPQTNKGNSIGKVLAVFGISVMTLGTVFSASLLTSTNTAPSDTSALIPTGSNLVESNTPTPTNTNIPTPTFTPSPTIIYTPTFTPSPTVIYTPTLTPTPTITVPPTNTPTPSLTPTPFVLEIECGPIDVNGDLRIDYADLPAFQSAYYHKCSDTPYLLGCGGKDTNNDGYVDFIDYLYFINNYYPKTLDCTIY